MPKFRHRIIRASAGTGKTFQLSNRFLGLLATGEASGRVLASTFTKKAAGEILDRVILRLAEAALDDSKFSELANFLEATPANFSHSDCVTLVRDVARNLHRLRIGTLDSFFAQLARSYGLELGLPPGWAIVEELDDIALREEALQLVLEKHDVGDLRNLLNLLTKGEVSRGIGDVLRSTVNELYGLFLETDEAAWKTIERPAPLAREILAAALESIRTATLPADKRIAAARDKDYQAALADDWDLFIRGGLANRVLNGGDSYYNKPLPGEILVAYRQLLEHARAELVGRVARQTEATFDLLHRFDEHYQRLKHERQALRFDDVTRRLAGMATTLGTVQSNATPTGTGVDRLGFRLDGRIDHLLLDEFQDTSPEQWQALEPFARYVAQARGRGSFFCVGDMKQAIYGWRGGVAEIFDTVAGALPGLNEESLTKSFRSSGIVIEAVNALFTGVPRHSNLGRAADAVTDWCAKFQAHSTAKPELPGYVALEVIPEDTDDLGTLHPTLKFAANRVAEIVAAAPGRSVGVLVRTNQSVRQLIFALRAAGIAASEEGGNPLNDAASVLLMFSLLKMIDHPGDSVARFHVASSPLGEFLAFTEHDDDRAASELASQLRGELITRGYGPALQRWGVVLANHCDDREANRLRELVDLAFDYQPQATLRVTDFIRFVEHQRVSDPTAAVVRVMTVHQSKGLEFDIVVLPELDKPITGQSPDFVVHRPTPTSRVDRVCRYVNEDLQILLPKPVRDMFDATTTRMVTESLCVLYVALTRAVHALHLIIAPSSQSEKMLPKTFAGLVRAALTDGSRAEAGTTLYEIGDRNWYRQPIEATHTGVVSEPQTETLAVPFADAADNRQRGLDRISPSGLEGGRFVRLGNQRFDSHAAGRQFGTAIHALFAAVSWSDESPISTNQLLAIATDTLNDIEQATLEPQAVVAKFQTMLDHPVIGRAISKGQYADEASSIWDSQRLPANQLRRLRWEVRTEYPFAIRLGDQIMTGSIDRLVLGYDGDTLIAADVLDFKTDTLDTANPASLNDKVAYYLPQLEAYREAVRKLTGLAKEHIAARLLFVGTGTLYPSI